MRARVAAGLACTLAFACADEPTGPPGSLIVSVAATSARWLVVDDTLRLEVHARDYRGEALPGVAVAWSSSDARIVAVSPEGVVTAMGPGTATVTGSVGTVSGTVQLSVADPEAAVLLSLYLSTNGEDWIQNDNWFENHDLGTWYGVETDSAGRVIELDLPENNLEGRIPPRLGDLAHLQKLDLSGNELAGEIPGELGGLANLERLDLSGNELDGHIPADYDDTGLSTLSDLVWLDLSGNRLDGEIPWALGLLANLERLDLSGNKLYGLIPAEYYDKGLGALTNLVWLDLSGNRLDGEIPWALGQLTNLERLDLSENELWGSIPASNNDGLDALSNLTWLNLSGNQLNGDIPWELGLLVNLETLWLSYNQLEGSLPSELGSLAHLTWLILGDNPFLTGPLPQSFLDLELEVFGYANTGLCVPGGSDFDNWLDEIWQHLGTGVVCAASGDRGALEALYDSTGGPDWTNSENWKSDEALNDWYGVSASPSDTVTDVSLAENNLVGSLPPQLGSLGALKLLWLYDNQLSGPIPAELGNLGALKQLGLYNNQLSGPIPMELGNLSALRVLSLHGNQFSGSIPVELGNLSALGVLWLHDNALSGAIPVSFANLGNLVVLRVAGNDVCVPRSDTVFTAWLEGVDHDTDGLPSCPGAPDLLVSSVDPAEITLVAGGSADTVTFTIRNAGDRAADSTTATIRASSDSTITTDDNQLGDTLAVPELAAADSTELAIVFSAPAGLSPQVLYVGLCVEPVSAESDTANNCSRAVKVVVIADVTNLTNHSANDIGPTWSPDGARIAFASYRDGNAEIYAMNANGTDVIRLTNHSANDHDPAWSPDSVRIAFSRDRRDGNQIIPEIYLVNTDGTGVTQLTSRSEGAGHAAWSPDGTRIAFASPGIHVMNDDGTGVTQLTSHSDHNPAWSPDSTRIAFQSYRDGNAEIYVMDSDGCCVERLTNHSADDGRPVWSPDGTRIAFDSERDGNREVYVMNADGTGVTKLTNHSADDFSGAWSPDGSQIAFTSYRDGNAEIYVMNVPASGATAANRVERYLHIYSYE